MEIQIQRIDPWVTEEDLYKEVADALHNPPVRCPGQGITNFKLQLPTTAKGKHKGHAFLTIAETSTAAAFLDFCSTERKRRPLVVRRDKRSNCLKLIGNGLGSEMVIESLLNHPFEDWDTRQKRLLAQKSPVGIQAGGTGQATPQPPSLPTQNLIRTQPLLTRPRKNPSPQNNGLWSIIQFGVICEDGSFSIEDFDALQVPLPSGFDPKSQTLSFGDHINSIRILFNNIVSWSIDASHNSLAFELESPATFIRQGRSSSFFDFHNKVEREHLIQNRSRYRVPLIGSHFRVMFNSPQDLDYFCREARPFLIRAGPPRENARQVVRRNLTDPDAFEAAGFYCANIDLQVAFQFEKLFRNGLYSPTVNDILKRHTRRLIKFHGSLFAAKVLESLATSSKQAQVRDKQTKCLLSSSRLEGRIEEEEKRVQRHVETEIDPFQKDAAATAQVYHVTITPTRTLLDGPFLDASNRVLRMFPEFGSYFIRVAFADEDGERFPVSRHDLTAIDSESYVRERVGDTLKKGITIAGRRFEALAWSSAGLGSHHCWFVASFVDKHGKSWNAERIRQALGDFSRVDVYPARYGARLSQAFSATSSTITIPEEWTQIIEDKYSNAKKSSDPSERFLLTDGVGQISLELMKIVWTKFCEVKGLRRELQVTDEDPTRIPSAIQFRCGGAKGVLCVNPLLKGTAIKLRPSMIKFDSPAHRELEVSTTSFRPLPARLNRPLINALEDLGVEKEPFLALQSVAIDSAKSARDSFQQASLLLGSFSLSDSAKIQELFSRLHNILGIVPRDLDSDGVLNRLCTILIAAVLGDLKRKARVPVAGCTLIGVVDETGLLAKNEIYAQVDVGQDGGTRIFEGRVMLGRSPTIHPGDVRMVNAIRPPENHPLRQLRNVLVFNADPTGRPLMSMLGGGDLDGDLYTIYEDASIYPKFLQSPVEYKSVKNRSLGKACSFDDLADFFVDFIINDQIGLVSTFHLQIADKSPLHSMDPDCLKLAHLHSKAVDFRKTGQAVHRTEIPMPPINEARPDFIAQKIIGPGVYRSERALGYLYRAIPEDLTDTPHGDKPSWRRGPTTLSKILEAPGSASDLIAILVALAQKHPQIRPLEMKMLEMQQRYKPLLYSFVYHLSRLAAWIPESRAESEWLSEEEILVGTQVMATKKQQLKRRQERLQNATSELFPILKTQLQLIATTSDSEDATAIRSVVKEKAGTSQRGSRTFAAVSVPTTNRNDGWNGFGNGVGGSKTNGAGRQSRPKPKTVYIDGEEMILHVKEHDAKGWSSSEGDEYSSPFDTPTRVGHQAKKRRSKGSQGGGNQNRGESDDGKEMNRGEERRNWRWEMQHLFSACWLGATEIQTRHFAGNTFAVIALGCLLETVEQWQNDRIKQQQRQASSLSHPSGKRI